VASAAAAIAAAQRLEPAVVILDMHLPDLDGIEAAELIRRRIPASRVLLLTPICHAGAVKRAVAAGALGLMRKDVAPGRLVSAVRDVGHGIHVYDPRLVDCLLRDRNDVPTASELRVLEHVAKGGTVREVAAALSLAQGTVRNYISSVIAKTQARNRLDAIRIAREFGWLV